MSEDFPGIWSNVISINSFLDEKATAWGVTWDTWDELIRILWDYSVVDGRPSFTQDPDHTLLDAWESHAKDRDGRYEISPELLGQILDWNFEV